LAQETIVKVGVNAIIMATTEVSTIQLNEVPRRRYRAFVSVVRAGLYSLIVLGTAVGAGVYGLRTNGIFGCQASGYSPSRYLGYCNAKSYGDYDHGAFWFDLEPTAGAAAANAQVLFVGNSRIGFGFSSKATDDWFSSLSTNYYLLGFTHYENYTFEGPLLRKLHPRAKVYVINIDTFFDKSETQPGKTVMSDPSAEARYGKKRDWQSIHKEVCGTFKAICGHDIAIFRSRATGAWFATGGQLKSAPVSYDDDIDQNMLASYTALGNEFLPGLTADRSCTILTIVPKVKTEIGTARAIASGLDQTLVAPRLTGLMTFDGYHLASESAQRWSTAFFEEAGPQIRKCLSQ
jgi:hypothetical protein